MEPTDFENWCAGEMGCKPDLIMNNRRNDSFSAAGYKLRDIDARYRAYMAGVRSRLPYQTPPKGDEDGMD